MAGKHEAPCDVTGLVRGGLGAGGGNQEGLLDGRALKEACSLAGSLLLERREKLGGNGMSSRTALAL